MSKKFMSLAMLLVVSLVAGSAWADLELYYSLDEGAGTAVSDLSGNGRDGTVMGSPAWVEGVFGSALEFTGTAGDYVNVDGFKGILAIDGVQQPFSVTNWFRTTETAGDREMVTWGTNVGTQRSTWRVHQGRLRCEHGSGNLRGNTYVNDGEWHHGALTVSENATLRPEMTKMYVDGVEDTYFSGSDNRYNLTEGTDVGIGWGAPNNGRYWIGGIDDVAIFSHVLTPDEVVAVMENTPLPNFNKAAKPSPANGMVDLPYYVDTLSWRGGVNAVSRDVYFGTSFEDVNGASVDDPRDVLLSAALTETSLPMPDLALETTYFWRVDEVNSPPDSTVHKGDVWSFTVEPVALDLGSVAGATASSADANSTPDKTIDGSGLSDGAHGTDLATMWLTDMADVDARWIQYDLGKAYTLNTMTVWNHNSQTESFLGYGVKEAKIETSADGETWTEFGIVEIPQAPGAEGYTGSDIDLTGAAGRYVRITAVSNYSILGLTQAGLSEVRFSYIPVNSRELTPETGSTVSGLAVDLSWRSGRYTAEHQVLFSSDLAAVEDGSAVIGTTPDRSFTVGDLDLNGNYYWQLVDVAADGTAYPGDILNLRVSDSLAVDDMEMYADEDGLFIWQTWADGFGHDDNGSKVGNGDSAEKSVVFEGRQSLPMTFDNTTAPVSETTRTFDAPVDLTAGDAESLQLHVRGDAPGVVLGTDTITVGASGADLWTANDEGRFVYKSLVGDGSITAKVESLAVVHAWAKAGVMIRETTDANSAAAYPVTSGSSGMTFQHRLETAVNATSDTGVRGDWADRNDRPVWVRVERIGDELNGYISVDGETWEPSANNPQTIVMVPEVKIGLCATSHDNNVSTVAVFSNISTTGDVTGDWNVVEWGGGTSGHPNNDPAPMYLRLADADGNEKTFDHPNPEASLMTDWDAWEIPLTDLSPVDPAKLNSITVGVGGSDVSGKVYVDYIHTKNVIEGILALYEFEGDAQDTSGNGLHGTVTDGEFVSSGAPGKGMALQLNGAGNVDLGNPASLDFATGDWTVAAWFNTGMTGTGDDFKGAIVAKGGDTGGGHRYALIMSESTEGVVSLICDDDASKIQTHSTSVTNDNEWHHVVGQRNNPSINIYIDGVMEATSDVGADYDLSGTVQHNAYIGAVTNHSEGTLYKIYNGLVDDVRIYDRALTEAEILFLSGQ